jgi:hypothetical protein
VDAIADAEAGRPDGLEIPLLRADEEDVSQCQVPASLNATERNPVFLALTGVPRAIRH